MVIFVLLAVAAGVSVVAARIINYRLAEKIGIIQGTFYNYAVGLIFSIIIMLISFEFMNLPNINFRAIPVWAYLGGMTGVAVVMLSSFITPRVSSFYLTLFIFAGQLLVGIITDYFISSKLSTGKIVGGLFVLAGLSYNLLIDRKKESSDGFSTRTDKPDIEESGQ